MGYRKLALSFASIILLVLSVLIPPLSFLIWIAFAPLLIAVEKEKAVKTFLLGLWVGTFFSSALLYWITRYELRIFLNIIALAIPFFGFFALLTRWLKCRYDHNLVNVFAPPLAWSTVSFFYSLTPVNILGDQIAMFQAPLFPSLVRITGSSGIAFLILTANSLLAVLFIEKKKHALNGLFLLLVLLALGTLNTNFFSTSFPIRVALIQHNFPIASEWRDLHQKEILDTYERVIREIGETADLIVFPQYGLPKDVLREPEWLERLARFKNTSILLSTYVPKIPGGRLTEGERFDTALLFSPAEPVQEYRAITPPPFRRIGQVPGNERKPLLIKGNKIGVMLCYEDAHPKEGRAWIQNKAELLFALSNPGHFLGTLLPHYHLLHDRIRAIETGRFVVRVSPNGFSAVINPNGKVVIQSKLNEARIVRETIYPTSYETPFTRIGPILTPALSCLTLVLLMGSYVRDSMKRLARNRR
ncbi:MAG: apolipoprotein N-acyltransferase [Candidatus Omnitrophica bacterium]|nr:apolipoprotein N-acyltransferase [Candidatus Omnitrophota bacterium]